MKDVLWETLIAGTWHCCQPLPTVPSPELAKPGTRTPALTELTAWQRPEAGGCWKNPENAHGLVVVSSLKKQEVGMVSKAASTEPKASWITAETKNRSKESTMPAPPGGGWIWRPHCWRLSTVGSPTSRHLSPSKATSELGCRIPELNWHRMLHSPTPCQEVRTLWRCTSWL